MICGGDRRELLEAGQTGTQKQGTKVDCEDAPLPGTLVVGCPGQAWGNLAPPLYSRCGGHWGPHQVWRAVEPQQELPVAPLGLEAGSGHLEDEE